MKTQTFTDKLPLILRTLSFCHFNRQGVTAHWRKAGFMSEGCLQQPHSNVKCNCGHVRLPYLLMIEVPQTRVPKIGKASYGNPVNTGNYSQQTPGDLKPPTSWNCDVLWEPVFSAARFMDLERKTLILHFVATSHNRAINIVSIKYVVGSWSWCFERSRFRVTPFTDIAFPLDAFGRSASPPAP